MKEQFVTYKIALALRELGFDEPCMARYEVRTNELTEVMFPKLQMFVRTDSQEEFSWQICSAPLYQQVFDWFIKKHNMFIDIFKWSVKYYVNDELLSPRFLFDIDTYGEYSDDLIYQSINDELKYASYYDTREAAILKTIYLIKNK